MNCGDPIIDGLLAGEASIQPLISGASGVSVGYLQDLLRGHGYTSLPDPRAASYATYGPLTCRAVADYRRMNGLAAGEQTDSRVLAEIVRRPASHAVLSPAYLPLVLNVPFTPIARFVWLTSLFETGGFLGVLNLNTDQCGVSFGILQWSQKPGQLHEILQACCTQEPAEWARIIGGTAILAHTAKPNGGVDSRGVSTDPSFELTKDPWKSKLRELSASPAIERVQVAVASGVYQNELAKIRLYAHEIRSERGFAFMLDLANQFGAARVEQHYRSAALSEATEAEIMKQLEDAFTNIARPQFQPQVRARREFFRTSSMLSDSVPG